MNSNSTTLVIGGCRSGKSRHALHLAEVIADKRRLFIATCIPYDDEMKRRVAKHQDERGEDWQTLEVPVQLSEAIEHHSKNSNVILIDCLTLWISNIMMETSDYQVFARYLQHFTASLKTAKCPVLCVSNEVGCGIVPENEIARRFRDWMGYANQQIAASVNRVIWMVAGIPVTISG